MLPSVPDFCAVIRMNAPDGQLKEGGGGVEVFLHWMYGDVNRPVGASEGQNSHQV